MLGLKLKIKGVGEVEKRYPKLDASNSHDVKSAGGKAFHISGVESVCVFDEAGDVHLYLKDNGDGTYTRESY